MSLTFNQTFERFYIYRNDETYYLICHNKQREKSLLFSINRMVKELDINII